MSTATAPLGMVELLVREAKNHLEVVLAANALGYYESALEAQWLAKEALDAIREELLRPNRKLQNPCRDLDT
jgi:hypothetical protein